MGEFKIRRNQRFRESVLVEYRGSHMSGQGLMRDLSLSGMHIRGNVPVSVGMILSLRVAIAGETAPLVIDRLTVKWVKDHTFGVEIEQLSDASHAQLKRLITTLVHNKSWSSKKR